MDIWRHRSTDLLAVLLTFLSCLLFCQAVTLPITATFSSYHQNTDAGRDTAMNGVTYFSNYFEQLTGTAYVFQLWTQPSTEGPSVYFFSPTATHSFRRMGMLTAYGQDGCRAVVLRAIKDLYLVASLPANLQIYQLTFNTLANIYAQTSWENSNSITSPWSLLSEPMSTDYMYFIDGATDPVNFLYKWDVKKPSRDPGPGIQLGTKISRTWLLIGNSLWIYSQGPTDMVYVDRTTFTQTTVLTGNVHPRDAWIDNQDPNVVFVIRFMSPWGTARVDIGATSYLHTHSIPSVGSGPDFSVILMLGKSGYLGFVRGKQFPNPPFRTYLKSDLVEVSSNLYQPKLFNDYTLDSFVAGRAVDSGKFEINYALQVSTSGIYNFQSWKIIVDVCVTRSQLICTACPAGYYMDKPDYIDNSCLPEKNGHDDALEKSVVPCQDPNCLHCGDDLRNCTKCEGNSPKPFLFESRCIGLSDIPPEYGVNQTSHEVLRCEVPNCVMCQTNFQICDGCDLVFGYSVSQSGQCMFNNSTAAKVVSVFYDWRQQTATVEFDFDIKLSGDDYLLNFTVMDVNTSREYTCEQLDCVKQVQSRGVSVKFERKLSFTKGVVGLHSNQRLNISRGNDSRLFTAYPVVIPAELPVDISSANNSLEVPSMIYTSVKSIQLPATLFFAAVNPSVSVLFDETFARITTIAFYSSPPMIVLDQAILKFKDTTLLPFQIPNLFDWILLPSDCEPSAMLKRYGYQCRFAENFGVDLTIFMLMTLFTVILKLWAKLAKSQTKILPSQRQVCDSATVMTITPQRPRVEQITLGQALTWLDTNFGFVLLWAKVEGKQAEYLVFAFQDFWSNDGSKNRILSTLVASVSLLHVVFSVWGTQKLVAFITSWYKLSFSSRATQVMNFAIDEVVRKPQKLDSQPKHQEVGSVTASIRNTSPVGESSVQSGSTSLTVVIDRLRIIDLTTNKQLETTWFYPLRFWYDQIKIPESRAQLRVPLISTLKNVISALFVIGLPSHPKIQCLGGITTEVLWFLFKYGNTLKTSTLDVLTELVLSVAIVIFIMGKYFSYSVSEEFLQDKLAIWMLTIILVMMLVTALVTILSVAVWAFSLYSKKQASRLPKSTDNTDKTFLLESTPRLRKTDQTGDRHSPGFPVRDVQVVQPSPRESSKETVGQGRGSSLPQTLQQQSLMRLKFIASNPSIVLKLSKHRRITSPRK